MNDKLKALYLANDQNGICQLLYKMAEQLIQKNTKGKTPIDIHDPEDFKQEIVSYTWINLTKLKNPDRIYHYCYTVMTRRLWKLVKRARSKAKSADKYRELTVNLYPKEVLEVDRRQWR